MRASGVLLPVFSLPSPHGIGCFSKEAYEWVDFLKLAGQQYSAAGTDKLWRFPVSVLFYVCGQPVFY